MLRALGSAEKSSMAALQVFLYDSALIAVGVGLLLGAACCTAVSRSWIAMGVRLALLVAWLVCSLPLPALIAVHGYVPVSAVVAGYLGLCGVGAVAVSVGHAAQRALHGPLGALFAGGVLLAPLVTAWTWAALLPAPYQALGQYLSLLEKHFYPAMRGVLRMSDFVYFASFIYAGLMLGLLLPFAREKAGSRAVWAGSLVAVLACMVAGNYLSFQHEVRRDWSSTFSGPSAGTLTLLQALPRPEAVLLVVAPRSPQAQAVRPYARALSSALGVQLEEREALRHPALTRKHRVPGNGHLVVVHSESGNDTWASDVIPLGTTVTEVHRRLSVLDDEVRQAAARRLHRIVPRAERERRRKRLHVPDDERPLFWLAAFAPAACAALLALAGGFFLRRRQGAS